MTIDTRTITFDTRGSSQRLKLTQRVQQAVTDSGCVSGTATVFAAHTTVAIVISEFEHGILDDLSSVIERLVPEETTYRHNELGRDDNAHSHLRSTLLGASVTIPFSEGRLLLGRWQQVVLIDFDTHPRSRNVDIQVMGE